MAFCEMHSYLSHQNHQMFKTSQRKVIMQGKLIAVAYLLCVHIEASSLWAEFVNKNRCISVRLAFEEVKRIKF